MGVKIYQKNGELRYRLVPEEVIESDVKFLKAQLKDEYEKTKGWNKSKSMRLIGEVPGEVIYNYLMTKGIPPHLHMEWRQADNGKNMKEFLKEFPMFKCEL